ncbi:MAG: FAD:protein FMN transferase [Acidobacteria bacterium]|nr:FAD:protein FMN transferase [Acidobacteriota bacterium]
MTRRAARRAAYGLLAGFLLGVGGAPAATTLAPVPVERSVYLMGTVATFAVDAADRTAGLRQLERMVRIVEAVEAELSTWRADSVLGRLNRQPVGEAMSAPMTVCDLLERVGTWHDATGGAFDPAIGSLIEAWDLRGEGRQPDDPTLQAARRNAGWEHLTVGFRDAGECAITRAADVTMDAGAFGKGEAIDRVRRTEGGEADAWLIDFGGQVAAAGASWPVAIAHPVRRNEAALEITLSEGSLATSGGSESDLTLPDGTRIGHILDPRSGLPATARRPFSVSVWHERALAADILSTALYVMGPEEGIAWAEARGIAACFLVADAADEVDVRATSAFEARF